MEATARKALKRLSYIEGHLAGIRRMIEEDKLCVEIMRQTYAVRHAIRKMEVLLLRAHLDSRVVANVRCGGGGQSILELTELYVAPDPRGDFDGNATSNP